MHGEAEPGDTGADVATAATAGLGRAARRRQLARWNKNKRRAAIATAVAIVGGGLTVATMDRHSTDRTQAATAPDRHSMGVAEEKVPESSRPVPAPPTEDRTARDAAEARGTGAARQQPRAVPAFAEPPIAQPSAAIPPPVAASQPAAQGTDHAPARRAAAPDNSATATQPSGSPDSSDSTEASPSQDDPAPASTSPSALCLLVLCLG
ncbi:hypothetical protein ACKI2E_39340 [Streptomyces galilaeus]|uniref:hypothetical protein n=1 Tax=Streptomyces galilaeus TaxID=33899 RepID=UPI0038F6546E